MIPIIKKSLKSFDDHKFFLLTFDHSKEMVDKMLDGLNVNVLTSFKKNNQS